MATEIGSKLDRRAAILKAAREVLATKGWEAAKISEIVARAGVAQGTFYLYFPSKSALVVALTEEMNLQTMARLQEAVAQSDSLGAAITNGVRATFEVMGRYRDVLDIIHSRIGMAELRALCEEMYQPFYTFISDLIRQGQSQNVMAADVNPEIAARLIVGLIEHAGDECFVHCVQIPSEAYMMEVARFLRGALGAP
ncbi:MAG: TetR/AcrR family transcriptional regulator [Ktedonobacterales bacterium]